MQKCGFGASTAQTDKCCRNECPMVLKLCGNVIITESGVLDVHSEPVSGANSYLANVQGRVETSRDHIEDVCRGTDERVCEMKVSELVSYEDSGGKKIS